MFCFQIINFTNRLKNTFCKQPFEIFPTKAFCGYSFLSKKEKYFFDFQNKAIPSQSEIFS